MSSKKKIRKHHSNFFKRIINFFFPSVNTYVSGKLFVSGAGSLEFSFESYPNNVFVYFNDSQQAPSCNPDYEDYLNWQVIPYTSHCTLTIEWDVSNMREIYWTAY